MFREAVRIWTSASVPRTLVPRPARIAVGAGVTTGLAVVLIAVLSGCGPSPLSPSGTNSGTSGGPIEQTWSDVIGGRPAFYLGDEVDGFAVTDVTDADGRILVQYGPCMDPDPNEECVRRPIVTTQPKGLWDQAVDHIPDEASQDETVCQRRAPILGVPAALLMGELTVFTGSSMVGLTYYQRVPEGYVPDRAMELRLVGKLRRVGQPAAATLPPPDADLVALLDRECGPRP
jgi:hypothetical protein